MFRPRTGETYERTITREVIKIESVEGARMLADGLGYVRLLQFGERTTRELREALESLEQQEMKGLVLDLRDNPGGLLDAAVDVCEMFFQRGELVVYTQGRTLDSREDILALSRVAPRAYPIAILINSGSASASEIVAGALSDTGRAVLVGETSFGKGSVQTVFPIRGTKDGIRLTTAYYYLPSGTRINGKGIAPDIAITLSVEEDRKLVIQRNRLPLMSDEDFAEQFEFEPIEDRQLAAAVDALRGVLAVGGQHLSAN
jgi:carboxyl-terminal processing protease